ncbi:hypothetical protein EVAR_87325_1 [Eumeta japonica]|uniref:Uncharacterized protein n=1 Tax=Eumeta variegata TaxID=151549 RepID=A0A4C1SBI9_EUMVA|nr:hypothetical protein EVAR_87325_1 [Eumeta japonica]
MLRRAKRRCGAREGRAIHIHLWPCPTVPTSGQTREGRRRRCTYANIEILRYETLFVAYFDAERHASQRASETFTQTQARQALDANATHLKEPLRCLRRLRPVRPWMLNATHLKGL